MSSYDRDTCSRCGQLFHDDNLENCCVCKRLTCPYCAGSVDVMVDGKKRTRWYCDVCREPGMPPPKP